MSGLCPNIVRQLYEDHSNIAKVLDLLDAQMSVLQQGKTPDYVVMVDAMRYMMHYPDASHHRRENLLLKKLKERDSSSSVIVHELWEEHETLAEKGKQFLESLQLVANDSVMPRDAFESQGHAYIMLLRNHMNKEEEQVLLRAQEVLHDADWREIDSAMEFKDDPVFGKVIEEEYRTLYDYLTRQTSVDQQIETKTAEC